MLLVGRKRSGSSDEEGESSRAKQRRYDTDGHVYEVRLLVQSQVSKTHD